MKKYILMFLLATTIHTYLQGFLGSWFSNTKENVSAFCAVGSIAASLYCGKYFGEKANINSTNHFFMLNAKQNKKLQIINLLLASATGLTLLAEKTSSFYGHHTLNTFLQNKIIPSAFLTVLGNLNIQLFLATAQKTFLERQQNHHVNAQFLPAQGIIGQPLAAPPEPSPTRARG